MRRSVTLLAVAAFAASLAAGAAEAAPCKDAKGKFIKCPAPPPSAARCRDKTTKAFAKCGGPNTEPVPMSSAAAAPAKPAAAPMKTAAAPAKAATPMKK